MDTWMWIVLAILVVLAVAAIVYALVVRQRSAKLQERFGPEYDRRVESADSRREAEGELRDVQERREHIEITPLPESSRRRYASEWEAIQRQFVERPVTAVAAADDLIVAVMAERGYPVGQFDEQADLVSADFPEVAGRYRNAHTVREKESEATTEDLRQAFVHYRALFDEMLEHDQGVRREGNRR